MSKPKWLKKAAELWKKRKIKELVEFLEAYCKENPDDVKALKFLLDILVASGKGKEIVDLVGNSPVRFRDDVVMQRYLEALDGIGEKERLLEDAKAFFEKWKDDASGYRILCYAYELLCMHNEALRVVEEGLKRFPDSASLWVAKAEVLKSMKRYDDALEAIERASKLEKSDLVDLVRARILIRLKRYWEAANILTSILLRGIPLGFIDLWHLFQISTLILHPIALRHVGEIMYALRPNDYRSLRALAYSLLARKKLKRALATIDMAIRLKPDYPELYIDKVMILEFMRRKKEALRFLEEASRRFPDDEEILGYLGSTYLELGDFGGVHRVLGRFEERGLTSTLNYLILKGDFLVRLGRREEAIDLYMRALRKTSKGTATCRGIVRRLRELGVKVDEDSCS